MEYAGPHAEPDLLAALAGMAEHHRRDRPADGRVLLRRHPPAIEELRDLDQPGGHRVDEIDEDAERAVGGDRPADNSAGRKPLLGRFPHYRTPRWPNDQAQQRRRRGEKTNTEKPTSRPVCCNVWFVVESAGPF